MEIIVGTTNAGKLAEMQRGLPDLTLVSVEKFLSAGFVTPAETGTSYFSNAYQKAQAYAKACGRPVLADDGGLELHAFPHLLGLKTQRFFKASDFHEQNQEILALLREPATSRAVTLRATQVYYVSGDCFYTATAELAGEIVALRGSGGYGFDEIFFVPELGQTLAELPTDVRESLAPRLNALKKICTQLEGKHDV